MPRQRFTHLLKANLLKANLLKANLLKPIALPTAQPILGLTLFSAVAISAYPAFSNPAPTFGDPQSVTSGSVASRSGIADLPPTNLSPNLSSPIAQVPSTPRINPPRSAVYAQPEAPYTLGSGDRIRIDIFQVPQYSGETDVLIDGTLNLPLAGKIAVGGMTLEQATAQVSAAYSQYLRRPLVTMSLLVRRPLEIGIAGEVNRPGSYTVTQTNASQFPTLTELIKTAGGMTRIADVRNIQVRRPQLSGIEQVINIDLWQLIQTGDLRADLALRDGDTIFIPATTVNLAEAPILAAASFAGDADKPINIAIVGEVFRPGTYSVTGSTAITAQAGTVGQVNGGITLPTVTRAIQVAGGIKPLADIRRVEVRRLTRAGTEQVFAVNLWDLLQAGDLRQDAILQEGDTVVIPTATSPSAAESAQIATASFSPAQIRVNVVGEVTTPGVVQVPPNTPLNQAILAAGGFNNRARRGSIELIRLNPDGTVVKQKIDIDFAQGINETNNPAMRNDDVVIVRRSGIASVGDALGNLLTPLNSVFSILQAPFRFIDIFGND
ncbi:MAG: sugar ABC transporter substrate-binding protein [Leptolyngbyaceae cyanobacterium CRU_2_3]|nr:sugar ABC transporter substrate-binding protein [Leptolyngbyaceae cyanobacterium CRU_2_3]